MVYLWKNQGAVCQAISSPVTLSLIVFLLNLNLLANEGTRKTPKGQAPTTSLGVCISETNDTVSDVNRLLRQLSINEIKKDPIQETKSAATKVRSLLNQISIKDHLAFIPCGTDGKLTNHTNLLEHSCAFADSTGNKVAEVYFEYSSEDSVYISSLDNYKEKHKSDRQLGKLLILEALRHAKKDGKTIATLAPLDNGTGKLFQYYLDLGFTCISMAGLPTGVPEKPWFDNCENMTGTLEVVMGKLEKEL